MAGHEDVVTPVTTEKLHSKRSEPQCYNCQIVGRVAWFCTLTPCCVKCAGEHTSRDCTWKRTDGPPKCTGCGREHVSASSRLRHEAVANDLALSSDLHQPELESFLLMLLPLALLRMPPYLRQRQSPLLQLTIPRRNAVRGTQRHCQHDAPLISSRAKTRDNMTAPNRDVRLTSWLLLLNTRVLQLHPPRRPIPVWIK
ncbi:uncharacterized protein LOC126234277 [Schistocerca nitens]|uniref:uncharacterized protein LOC126234277 n=1 Tax=Schistocerca nitens TaxID=7011 RepID=UPI0021187D05|nr:uncharacterized protein LOC126234277 [Schistocerca nitens]